MRVLVTGGAGFIGSHTVDLLLQSGYQVRILDALLPPAHEKAVLPDYLPRQAEFVHGDVTRRRDVDAALRGVDAVFHLAAHQGYLPDFSTFFRVNTESTALLYEIVVDQKYPVCKIILASSQAVYGEGKHRCAVHGGQYPEMRPLEQLLQRDWELKCPVCGSTMAPELTDESAVKPGNQYAASKYALEVAGFTLGRRYGIPTVVMRYSITQGPRQSFRNAYSGICRIFTTRLLAGKPPLIYEDGRQLRDYVSVDGVARANLLVLERDEANLQSFNVGTGQPTSVLEYARLVAEKLGRDAEPQIPGEFRFGDTRHMISDTSRLRALGWEPRVPLDEIIEGYIDWVKAQPQAADHSLRAMAQMRRRRVLRRT